MTIRKLTAAALVSGAALVAAPAAAQNVDDINGDGYLDYAELAASLGADQALQLLGGDETALIDSTEYLSGDAEVESRAFVNSQEDEPEYRQDDDDFATLESLDASQDGDD